MNLKHTKGICETTLRYMENRKGLEKYNKITEKLGTKEFEKYTESGLMMDMEHR